LIPPAGVQSLYDVLRTFDPAVKAAAVLDVRQTYDNAFVQKSLATSADKR
jgi:hypothetical protein